MAEPRPASADQAALLRALVEHRLLIETGVPGVYGRGGAFEEVREAGFADVANLAGGMLRWRAEGHVVDGGTPTEYIAEYSI